MIRVVRSSVLLKQSQKYASSAVYHPPTLTNIPKRWNSLPQPLKEEIQEYLDWQMKGDWQEMTPEEKQAGYYISYGTWGPRSKATQKDTNSNQQINIPYLVIRGLFNVALFSAVGVAMVNLKRDKQTRSADDNGIIA